MRYNKILAICT